MKKIFLMLITAGSLLSCSNSETKVPETKVLGATSKLDMNALNQSFDAAWESKDSAKLANMMTEDVKLVSGRVLLNGKMEVAAKWLHTNLPIAGNLRTTVMKTNADNQTALEAGTFKLDVTLPQKPQFEQTGNYIFVWEKGADGAWKISYMQIEDNDPEIPAKK